MTRKWMINEDFFSSIGEEQLYVLGRLYTDGQVIDKPRCRVLRLKAKHDDIENLKQISQVLGSDRPVEQYEKYNELRVFSKRLVDSYKEIEPFILDFVREPIFLRGVFDSDGSIWFTTWKGKYVYPRASINKHKKDLIETLHSTWGGNFYKRIPKGGKKVIYRVMWQSMGDVRRVMTVIYGGGNVEPFPCIKRKYEKWLRALNLFVRVE